MTGRLRPLEVAPFEREGRAAVRLRDPLCISPAASEARGRLLEPAEWEFASRMGMGADVDELAATVGLAKDDAHALARALGDELLLDDAASRAAIESASAEFAALDARPPTGAGREYEGDAIDLRIRLAGQVANDWDMPAPPDLSGVWAPASGLHQRAPLFARSYAAVRHHAATFQRVLLLGSMPAPLGPPLVPLAKDLGTPFGRLAHDAQAVACLPASSANAELVHRGSRVLERHALFLRLLLPRLPVVPVLVSGAARQQRGEPAGPGELEDSVQSLRKVLALPGRALIVVACDLAELPGEMSPSPPPPAGRMLHGAGAGGRDATGWIVTGTVGERLRAEDSRLVDALTRTEPEQVWSLSRASDNALRRANAPLAWIAARLFSELRAEPDGAPVRGSLLGYQQSSERTGLVSGASIVFH